MTSTSIARLKITLDDVKPAVLRRVEVPLTIRLDRLHLVLQAAMGWTNSHLYEIRARGVGWGVPDPDWGDGPLDARKTRLLGVIEDTGAKTLKYLYDFGDGWEHTIKVEPDLNSVLGKSVLCQLLRAAVQGVCTTSSTSGWGSGDRHAGATAQKPQLQSRRYPRALSVDWWRPWVAEAIEPAYRSSWWPRASAGLSIGGSLGVLRVRRVNCKLFQGLGAKQPVDKMLPPHRRYNILRRIEAFRPNILRC